MIAAVTGATGYVGRFIVAKLLAEGVAVRAWRRPQSDLRGFSPGVVWIEGALGLRDATDALLAGADVLVHCALDHAAGRYRGGEGDDLPGFLRLNVGESLAMLARARQLGVARAVVLSSRAVFGGAPAGSEVDDDSPLCPDTAYGAAKAAMEAFGSWGRAERWGIAALRPTGVYGIVAPPERSKWFDLVAAALREEPLPARAGTEVHGRDVAEAVWQLLSAEPSRVAGRGFNCSDLAVSTRDLAVIVQEITTARGPLPDVPALSGPVMACSGLAALGMRFGGWPLLRETVAELVAAVQGAPSLRG